MGSNRQGRAGKRSLNLKKAVYDTQVDQIVYYEDLNTSEVWGKSKDNLEKGCRFWTWKNA